MELSDKTQRYMRLKLLEWFEEPRLVWGLTLHEPFVTDIRRGKYTDYQLRNMMRSLAHAGLMKFPPQASRTNGRVYALTDLGKLALKQLREAETQTSPRPGTAR